MSELLKTKGSRSSPISSIVTPSQTSTHNPAKKKEARPLPNPSAALIPSSLKLVVEAKAEADVAGKKLEVVVTSGT